jgi:outer membrane lipoprotein SlyB
MARQNFLQAKLKIVSVAILSGALVLSGCVQAPTAQELAMTRDECSSFRTPFTRISTERNARIERYAQIGAGVGLVLGAAIGEARNNNPLAGALVGAIAGGLIGAAGGYMSDLQRRSQTTAGLQRAINGDAARDLRETDELVQAMTRLNACRLNQIAQVERSVRAGGDRATATTQIRQIRRNVDLDNRVIRAVVGDLTRTRSLYIGALQQTGANTDSFVSSIQSYQPRATTPQQTALRIDRSARPRTSSAVANLGFAERELSAGAAAHLELIDARIASLNALLI